MIEEPRQPLTDANLNAIRDVLNRHRISYQWSILPDGFTPPTPQEIDDSITALLMEVAQRRQREAALPVLYGDGKHDDTAAVQAIIDGKPVLYQGEVREFWQRLPPVGTYIISGPGLTVPPEVEVNGVMSDLSMLRMNMTSYVPLHQAYEHAIRQNELYEAMQIVEQCGASPELTEAINRLGQRLKFIQADMQSAYQEAAQGTR